MECPHCGGVIGSGPEPLAHPVFDDRLQCLVVDDVRRRVPGYQWRLLRLLRERFGRFVETGFLAQHASSRPADGGDINSMKVQLCRLRRVLDGSPFAIATSHGIGYGLFPADQVEIESQPRYYGDCRYWRLRPGIADSADIRSLDIEGPHHHDPLVRRGDRVLRPKRDD